MLNVSARHNKTTAVRFAHKRDLTVVDRGDFVSFYNPRKRTSTKLQWIDVEWPFSQFCVAMEQVVGYNAPPVRRVAPPHLPFAAPAPAPVPAPAPAPVYVPPAPVYVAPQPNPAAPLPPG